MLLLGDERLPERTFRPDTRGFWDAFGDYAGAAYEVQRLSDNPSSNHEATIEAYDRRIAETEALTGVRLDHPYKYNKSELVSDDPLVPRRTPRLELIRRGEAEFARQLSELAVRFPDKAAALRADVPVIYDAKRAAIGASDALTAEQERTRLGGGAQMAADFAGRAGAWVRDPLNVGTMFLGGPAGGAARTVAGRILTRMSGEAAVSSAVETGLQYHADIWRRDTGLELGWDGILQQAGLAAGFGAAAGGIFQGGAEVIQRLRRAPPEAQQAFERVARGTGTPEDMKAVGEALGTPVADQDLTAFTRALEDDAATAAVLDADTPPRSVAAAVQAIEQGAPLPRLETPAVPEQTVFRQFRPSELLTDPGRFQFKQGGDAAGVTGALRGVTTWKPERADPLMVFEDTDGRFFVVDGHQRSGLARRLEEQGHPPITLNAYVFRAADGYTSGDITVRAALKNIGQGSGSAVDAAKVLRTGRLGVKDTGLPPNSALVRDAAGLARLSDDAFAMAVNEVVDARLAAVVGRLAEDPRFHAQMIEALKTAEARTIPEAESMVKDMLAEPFFEGVQDSLFGAEDFARMLLKEKAQVRAAALRSLRKDRAVFNRLVEEQGRIASAGNVLDTAANSERARSDAIIIEAIDRLSRQAGPVADALNAAAAAVARGERARDSAAAFTENVRRGIAEGHLGRSGLVETGQSLIPPAAGRAAIEPGTPEGAEAAAAALEAVAEPSARELEQAGQGSMFDVPAPVEAARLVEASPERSLEEIYAGELPRFQAELALSGAAIADALGIEFRNPGLKKMATAAEKMIRKGYRSTRQMTDLVRGGFIVDTPGQADDAVRMLGELFTVVDEGWRRNSVAYVDRKVLVQFGDGTIGEVQIWERQMRAANENGGHALYEEGRSLPAGDPRAGEIDDAQRALYEPVLAGLPPEWKAALGMSGSDGQRSAKASADTTRPLSSTSKGLTLDQSSPGARIAQASDPALMAGRYSQSKNVKGDFISPEDSTDPAKLQIEAGADGKAQTLLPGVAPVTSRQRLDVDAAKPMRGGAAPPPAGGLFDDAARGQIDLLDAIPAGTDAEGRPMLTTHAALTEEADRVGLLADVIASCKE